MNATQECAETCNSLLRGELSAIETYTQAMGQFHSETERTALQAIRADHANSAARLCDHLVEMGAVPATDSGPWGAFAKAVEGAAGMVGENPALAVLEQGEEHGMRDYEAAMKNPEVMDEIRAVIRDQRLPPLGEHIAALQRLRDL